MISLIVAMDEKNLIGAKQNLPWHLPEDLKLFKQRTLHHTIVMGRKTFESIGKILPKRSNIILSSNKNLKINNALVLNHINEVLKHLKPNEENFIIGGARIYQSFLPLADKIYITRIEGHYQGDTYFPQFDLKVWKLISSKQFKGFQIEIYNKTIY